MTTIHLDLSRLDYTPRHQAQHPTYPSIVWVKQRTMQAALYEPRHAKPES